MAFESRSNQYGTVFDTWQITKKLGRGSNGKTAVYQLSRKDDDWEETCALKVIALIAENGIYEELSPSRYNEWGTATGAYQKFFYDDADNKIQEKRKFSANSMETNDSYDYIEIQVPSDQVERLRAIYMNALPVPINIPDDVT